MATNVFGFHSTFKEGNVCPLPLCPSKLENKTDVIREGKRGTARTLLLHAKALRSHKSLVQVVLSQHQPVLREVVRPTGISLQK